MRDERRAVRLRWLLLFTTGKAMTSGFLLASIACAGGDPEPEQVPLGWGGTVEARLVREWPSDRMAGVQRLVVSDVPRFLLVPEIIGEITHSRTGERIPLQRYVTEGEFLGDGRVVLLYDISPPDSVLLHFFDPRSGEDTGILAPTGPGGEGLNWTHFNMAGAEGRIVLVGDNRVFGERVRPKPRKERDVWLADRTGRFTRSPSSVGAGELIGLYPDGSLVMMMDLGSTDTTVVSAIVSSRISETAEQPADPHNQALLFTTARFKERGSVAPWAHNVWRTLAVAGDTTWLVPTESPELIAVDRTGEVVLKIEWDAGDRSVPAGAPESIWEGAKRFPAAARLLIGQNGLIYVQRWTVRDDRPVQGPEWLVFNPKGDLVARVDIPSRWRVLAFGAASVVAVARGEDGFSDIRVHTMTKAGFGEVR